MALSHTWHIYLNDMSVCFDFALSSKSILIYIDKCAACICCIKIISVLNQPSGNICFSVFKAEGKLTIVAPLSKSKKNIGLEDVYGKENNVHFLAGFAEDD